MARRGCASVGFAMPLEKSLIPRVSLRATYFGVQVTMASVFSVVFVEFVPTTVSRRRTQGGEAVWRWSWKWWFWEKLWVVAAASRHKGM